MNKQAGRIMPATRPGKWSLWLIAAMFVLFLLGSTLTGTLYDSVPSGNTIQEDSAGRPALVLAMGAGLLAGIAALIAGLLAIFKQKERSILVYGASLIGALLVLFLAGEFLFPH